MNHFLSLLTLGLLCLPLASASASVSARPNPAAQEKSKNANPKDKGITGNFSVIAEDKIRVNVAEYLPHADPKTPLMLLFHDGSMNRAEYRYVAPKLNRMGFNCMVPDLRAGKNNLGHKNVTAAFASLVNVDSSFLAARKDMEALLVYARSSYPEAPIILLGCTYSASHSLRLAGEMAAFVDGVVAFSPAEYFAGLGKSKTWIEEGMPDVHCPVFIASRDVEREEWESLYQAIPEGRKRAFAPEESTHGARMLAPKSKGSAACWKALGAFLDEYFPRASQPAPTPAEPAQPKTLEGDKHVSLDRMLVLGASLSMGFFLPASLATMIDASCLAEHQPVRAKAEGGFAWDAMKVAREQVAFARELEPSLLLAVDFLFWLGYGSLNTEGEILTSESERLELLEAGLALLDGFDCPIVVGDYPDMSHAAGNGRMIAMSQLPRAETLAALNARLAQWAAERGRVLVLPIRESTANMISGEPFRMGNYRWPAGSESKVLQRDRLHPTLEGLAALTHSIALAMVQRGWSRPEEWQLDLGQVLAGFKRELKDVQRVGS